MKKLLILAMLFTVPSMINGETGQVKSLISLI